MIHSKTVLKLCDALRIFSALFVPVRKPATGICKRQDRLTYTGMLYDWICAIFKRLAIFGLYINRYPQMDECSCSTHIIGRDCCRDGPFQLG